MEQGHLGVGFDAEMARKGVYYRVDHMHAKGPKNISRGRALRIHRVNGHHSGRSVLQKQTVLLSRMMKGQNLGMQSHGYFIVRGSDGRWFGIPYQ